MSPVSHCLIYIRHYYVTTIVSGVDVVVVTTTFHSSVTVKDTANNVTTITTLY